MSTIELTHRPVVRYTKQGDHYSCGPAAIANAIKWSGKKFNWRKRKQEFIRTFEPLPGRVENGVRQGATPKAMWKAIKEHFPRAKKGKPRLGEIEDHLEAGGCVIAHVKSTTVNHYILIDSMSDDRKVFGIINMYSEGSVRTGMLRKDLRNFFRREVFGPWFIK